MPSTRDGSVWDQRTFIQATEHTVDSVAGGTWRSQRGDGALASRVVGLLLLS